MQRLRYEMSLLHAVWKAELPSPAESGYRYKPVRCPLDFYQIVIGYADTAKLTTFCKRNEHGSKPFHVHGIVNSVNIHIVGVHSV